MRPDTFRDDLKGRLASGRERRRKEGDEGAAAESHIEQAISRSTEMREKRMETDGIGGRGYIRAKMRRNVERMVLDPR